MLYLDKAIQTDYKYANAYCNKGIAYQSIMHYEEALVFYQKACKYRPDIIIFQNLYTTLCKKLKNFENQLNKPPLLHIPDSDREKHKTMIDDKLKEKDLFIADKGNV
jgi:tetratricopeptide (TPR) repeat protein